MFDSSAEAHLEASITRVVDSIRDGFDVDDIAVIVREAVEIAEVFGELNGEEKKAMALEFCNRLVDEFFGSSTPAIDKMIERLDLPGPEWVEATIWDPILKKIAPKIIKPALKASLPALIDLVVGAHNGNLKFTKE